MSNKTTVTKTTFAIAIVGTLILVFNDYIAAALGVPPVSDGLRIAVEAVVIPLALYLLPADFPNRRPKMKPIAPLFLLLLASQVAEASPARAVIATETATVWQQSFDDETGEEIPGIEEGVVEERPSLYVDLAVNLDFAVIDLSTREYELGVTPGIGYGVKWAPGWWTLSDVFLAFDVFVSAGVAETRADLPGLDAFVVDVLPSVVLMNWFAVGVGPRFVLSLQRGVPDEIHPILTFGLSKAL